MVDSDPILRASAMTYRQRNAGTWDSIPQRNQFQCLTDARTARLGAVYRDALDQVTPALEPEMDRISQEILDRHFGRFESRFRSIAGLLEGWEFRIVELNGAGDEML